MSVIKRFFKTGSRDEKYLLYGLTIYYTVFLIISFIQSPELTNDSYNYLQLAENIYKYTTFYSYVLSDPIDPVGLTLRPPIYSIFIIINFFSIELLKITQIILAISSMMLLRNSLKDYGYKSEYDLLLLILVIISPALGIYTQLVMSEILLQFFITCYIALMLKCLKQYNRRMLLLASLMLILSFLTKPVMYLFVIPHLLISLIWMKKIDKIYLVLSAFFPLITAFGYMLINEIRTGYFHFSSIQNVNLLRYNLYFFLIEKEGIELANSTIASINNTAHEFESFKDQSLYIQEAVINILLSRPVEYMLFHIKGVLRFFIDAGRFDIVKYLSLDEAETSFLLMINEKGISGIKKYFMEETDIGILIYLLFNLIASSIKFLIFVIGLITRKLDFRLILIGGGVILYVAFVTGPLGASRFIVPVLPIYLIMIAMILGKIKNDSYR